LYAVFVKVEDPLPPAVRVAEREFWRLLKQRYEELSAVQKANITFEAFRYAVMPDIHRAAFENVLKYPAVSPEIPRRK
jgi:hypothetical protein